MSIIDFYNQSNHFGKDLGMTYVVREPGIVEYRLKIESRHLATPLAAHGGVIGALVDAALGVAGLSLVHSENKVVSTVEYKINFLRPALLGDELIAVGKVEQRGGRLMVVSTRITNNRGEDVALAQGTFNIYPAEKAGYPGTTN